MTKQSITITHAIADALYNCGPGVVDYTRGVLDTLGYDDLSGRLASANSSYQVALALRERAAEQTSDKFLRLFGFTDAPKGVEEDLRGFKLELDAVWKEVEVLRQKASDWRANKDIFI